MDDKAVVGRCKLMAFGNAWVEKDVAESVCKKGVIVVENPDGRNFTSQVIEVDIHADNANFLVELENRYDVRNHVYADVLVQVGLHPHRPFGSDGHVVPADVLGVVRAVFREICGLCKSEFMVCCGHRHENARSRRR